MDWLTFYKSRTVLVTGHTGFKGAWLSIWLKKLGANVIGIAQPPDHSQPSLFELAETAFGMESIMLDVRDSGGVLDVFRQYRPDVVFHLAAQALVRRSYDDPIETYSTNIMGTANVLDACRSVSSVRSFVNVTTDKCYENKEWAWGYREIDALGGHDPYSSSKAASELVTSAYRSSYFKDRGTRIASARAGNVIGGGDWSDSRIIPDAVRAVSSGRALEIRNPYSVRPWQHVLDPLAGYLMLGEALQRDNNESFCEAWNFGPEVESALAVDDLITKLKLKWPKEFPEVLSRVNHEAPHEASYLYLDSTKAKRRLKWRPRIEIDAAIEMTAEWYYRYLHGGDDPGELTTSQIDSYESLVRS